MLVIMMSGHSVVVVSHSAKARAKHLFHALRAVESAVVTLTATALLTTLPNAQNVVTTTKQKVLEVLVVAVHE